MGLSIHLYVSNPKHKEWENRKQFSLKEAGDMKGLLPIIEDYYNDREPEKEELVYDTNITHNLTSMADAINLYKHLWRPEEININKAGELIIPLTLGIAELKSNPNKYKAYNAKNGWGTYEHFLPWLEEYLEACKLNPDAIIYVYR